MVQLSATRCCCIAILWVSLVSFAAITLCVASQRVFVVVVVVVVYFVIDSIRKLLDTPSYMIWCVVRYCTICLYAATQRRLRNIKLSIAVQFVKLALYENM
jgi:hypothetical protein